jgi:hypothetical protein
MLNMIAIPLLIGNDAKDGLFQGDFAALRNDFIDL